MCLASFWPSRLTRPSRNMASDRRKSGFWVLFGPFTVNHERIAQIVAFHSSLRATAISLMQTATQPTAISSDATDQLITDVSWWGGFISPESAALDAIVLGGKLEVIEDETLRRLLSGVAESCDATRPPRKHELRVRPLWRVWLPLLRAKTNLALRSAIPRRRFPV